MLFNVVSSCYLTWFRRVILTWFVVLFNVVSSCYFDVVSSCYLMWFRRVLDMFADVFIPAACRG